MTKALEAVVEVMLNVKFKHLDSRDQKYHLDKARKIVRAYLTASRAAGGDATGHAEVIAGSRLRGFADVARKVTKLTTAAPAPKDLIDRLRSEYKQPMRPITKGRLLIEAATEIERLRASLREAAAKLCNQEDQEAKARGDYRALYSIAQCIRALRTAALPPSEPGT